MPRILIFGATPSQGGIETFIVNVSKVTQGLAKIYLYNSSENKLAYQDKLEQKYGVHVFTVVSSLNLVGHFTRKFKYKKFFKQHQFDIVHINANSPSNYDFAQEALKSGAKVIYHSHNDSSESFVFKSNKLKLIQKLVRNYQRFRLNRLPIKKVAVSTNASKWMFSSKQKVRIIPNGVDFLKFKFSKIKREKTRKILNIGQNDTVLLTASRLTKQKNFTKALNIASLALKKGCIDHFVIIGDGDEMQSILQFINNLSLNIRDKIHVMGAQDDMQSWYSLADFLLMPSLYEGLPYSILEAQSNGLECFVSTAIPSQAVISESLMHFHENSESDLEWVNDIEKYRNQRILNAETGYINAIQSIYSLNNFKEIMCDLYGIRYK